MSDQTHGVFYPGHDSSCQECKRKDKRIEELEAITAEAVDDARLLKIDNERLRAALQWIAGNRMHPRCSTCATVEETARAALKGVGNDEL